MQLLSLTLDTPEENLALDEALLDQAEQDESSEEILRLWEPTRPMVVLGRSSRIDQEVDQIKCRQRGVPVLRRSSGGAAILAGPGCLMYAVVLNLKSRPQLKNIQNSHAYVLDRNVSALSPVVPEVFRQGISDLALGNRKFSGNSLRIKRRNVLYHGTLLYNFPLQEIAEFLGDAPRQPDYRVGRDHLEFLVNLPIGIQALRLAIVHGWNVRRSTDHWPRNDVEKLVLEKYGRNEWAREF